MKRINRLYGFTFIELLVTLAVVGMVLGTSVHALIQFRRSMSSGEQANELSRQATIFTEYLRNDLRNAVPPVKIQGLGCSQILQCSRNECSFPIFADAEGTIATVSYRLVGSSIQRQLGTAAPQELVTGAVASLSWSVHEDGVNCCSRFQAGRAWLHLDASFGRPDPTGRSSAPFRITTNMFPVRWNRLVKSSPGK